MISTTGIMSLIAAPVGAVITPKPDGSVDLTFDDYQKSIAVGQSVVFYNGDDVVGGGIIDKTW